ncbi:hypothetical protein HYPSUDRAFT_92069 [Hypholoma sublateritium FD-334 SS-4]|uniref:Ubiquitin 3 binding protein But2 C-terminal domain-containing protein n=1 Tax=Hypholoma sublateritium (strain FD-334 SS-4) TaxID=945553 RepID=A0A0D2N7P4_HYPSF|nr:hypothetical protein HYPSUDRAFT_92069 [Hypholoma sublateritium FD-334 SS-4]
MDMYMSLPQNEADSFDSLIPEHEKQDAKPTGRSSALLLCLTGVICLCAILDVVALVNLGNKLGEYKALETRPIDELPFLSSYSHLDDIYKEGKMKATPRGPTMQLPYSLTQVDSSAPEHVQEPYPDQFKAPESGMIPYNERRTIVTREISTIAEFFATDYGMENCSITLTIPEAPFERHEETIFDVWALKSDRTLDIRRLNWNSKPPRGKHLGTFSAIGPSTQQTPLYTCPSGTYQHVEMSCRQGPCHMHILASGQKEFSGLYMTQYQTM